MSREKKPKNMKELLKITAGLASDSANKNDVESRHDGNNESLAERQRFLSDALDHATVSEAETLKAFLAVIPTLPNSITSDESSSVIENFVQRYEMRIVDIIVDIDSANLFYQLGGLAALLPLLEHAIEDLRYVAIDAIRICCASNPYCQGLSTIEEISRPLIENSQSNVSLKIKEKTMSCISAFTRNNLAGVLQFIEFGGIESVWQSLTYAPGREKLILRTLYVVEALWDTDRRCFERFTAANIIELLKKILTEAEDMELLDETMGTLLHLLNAHKPARKLAQKLGLKEICQSAGQKLASTQDAAFELGVRFAADIVKHLN